MHGAIPTISKPINSKQALSISPWIGKGKVLLLPMHNYNMIYAHKFRKHEFD